MQLSNKFQKHSNCCLARMVCLKQMGLLLQTCHLEQSSRKINIRNHLVRLELSFRTSNCTPHHNITNIGDFRTKAGETRLSTSIWKILSIIRCHCQFGTLITLGSTWQWHIRYVRLALSRSNIFVRNKIKLNWLHLDWQNLEQVILRQHLVDKIEDKRNTKSVCQKEIW